MEKNILILSSTFPLDKHDPVPKFVESQIINLKKNYKNLNFFVIAPSIKNLPASSSKYYQQYRYRYFFSKFEVLGKNGILPSLRSNLLFLFIIPFFILFQLVFTLKFVKNNKVDLIYAHWVTPQAIVANIVKIIYKVPFVFTSHRKDVEILSYIPYFGKKLLNNIVKNSHKFTTVSNFTFLKLLQITDMNKMAINKNLTIPMGVNTNDYDAVLPSMPNVFELNNKIKLVFIGRFVKEKGVEKFLFEIKNFLECNNNFEVILCGSGKLFASYKNLINLLNINKKVRISESFLNTEELKFIYKNSNFIVIPSLSEGLPVVLQEALYFGNITISSIFSNASEYINHGVNGFLYNPFNEGELTKLLDEILNNKFDLLKIKQNAYKTGQKFNSKKIAIKTYKHLFID